MMGGLMAWRGGALSIAFSLASVVGGPCLAQDAAVKTASPESIPIPANACKTPEVLFPAAGFMIQCGKRIPKGIFLGSFLSPASDSVGDCAARCTASEKCVGFSLDNRETTADRVCTLLGSIESYADEQAWVAGTRIDRLGGLTASGSPDRSEPHAARPRSKMASKPKPLSKSRRIDDDQLTPTPDMKGLQPVYFATDRTRNAGTLQEASFTDEPTMDMTYGYAIVSIPKNHDIGNVERPKFRFLKFGVEPENDADHFRIKVLTDLGRDAFVNQLKGGADSILLFIHGYNVSFPDAIFRAAQIAFDANFAGTVLAFSWPSAGSLFKYDKDRESAEFASPHLAQIFRLVSEEIGKKNVYIVAHSMGNQVLVNALQLAASSKADMAISELVMAAPDVDVNVFRSKADQIRSVAKNITLYASSADKALRASGEKSFGTRLGFVSSTGPNIFPGIDTIDVTAVGDDMLGLDHSTFASSRAVLEDLGRLLRSLTHLPPDARTPTLKFMPDKATFTYWSYPVSVP